MGDICERLRSGSSKRKQLPIQCSAKMSQHQTFAHRSKHHYAKLIQLFKSRNSNMVNMRTLELYLALFLYCFIFVSVSTVDGFNLDVKFPTVLTGPSKKSYFGYSVDMYTGLDQTWLLVGAPKSNGRGEVFMCRYENGTAQPCRKVNIVQDNAASKTVKDMLGVTLKMGQGKQLLACAPFFTQQTETDERGQKNIYYDLIGTCYLAEDFTSPNPNTFKIAPCQSAKGIFHDGDEHGNCQAGLSAAFTEDGNNLLLATVGSFYRQGAIMLVPFPLSDDVNVLPIHTGEHKPQIPPNWDQGAYIVQSYDDNYQGYSVATGKSIGNSQLLFASAPRRFGYDMYGMVEVYDETMDGPLYNFTGTQSGEYFGSGLAVVDLNDDNLDDVVVGSPLYSDYDKKMAENGRVFVYYQMKAKTDPVYGTLSLSFTEPVIIDGKVNRARFGHVITSIGDVNQDGYNDIAIGAPYSSSNDESEMVGEGSLFIFNGGPDGLIIPASQEVIGMNLDNSSSSFGYSISGKKDVDRNGYPDVLAGAYTSDQAFLFRARPVVEISSQVTVDPKVIEIDKKSCPTGNGVSCFTIKTCFSYTGENLPPAIDITYEYDVDATKTGNDKRTYIMDDSPKTLKLLRESSSTSKEVCVEEYAFLKVDIRDKLTEISVAVSHSLVEKHEPVQPILNKLKPAESTAIVKIFKDCGADDICQADLQLTSELNSNAAYVGQEFPFVLGNKVLNKGEPAFLAMLVIEFPPQVYYVGQQDKQKSAGLYCNNVDQFVTCELGNPMKRDAHADISLKFRTVELKGNISKLDFTSFVNSTNPEHGVSNTEKKYLKVSVKSDIEIYNTSSPETIFLDDVNQKEDKKERIAITESSKMIIHRYEFVNSGPSDVESATIEIFWPLRTKSGKELLSFEQIIEQGATCSNPDKTRLKRETDAANNTSSDANYHYCENGAHCLRIPCEVGYLSRQQHVSISVQAKLPLSTVLENDLDSYIRSEVEFRINKFPYAIDPGPGPTIRTEVTTKCLYVREPEEKQVEWWIIAIAVIAGVLFLLLLVFVLWRCGFFKRKRKPEGEEERSQREKLNPGGVGEDEQEMENYLK